jgi:hypothetical protein
MSSEEEEETPCEEKEAPCNRRLVSTVPCTVSSSACVISIAAAALRIPKSQQIVTALIVTLLSIMVQYHGTEKSLVVCWYRGTEKTLMISIAAAALSIPQSRHSGIW